MGLERLAPLVVRSAEVGLFVRAQLVPVAEEELIRVTELALEPPFALANELASDVERYREADAVPSGELKRPRDSRST